MHGKSCCSHTYSAPTKKPNQHVPKGRYLRGSWGQYFGAVSHQKEANRLWERNDEEPQDLAATMAERFRKCDIMDGKLESATVIMWRTPGRIAASPLHNWLRSWAWT